MPFVEDNDPGFRRNVTAAPAVPDPAPDLVGPAFRQTNPLVSFVTALRNSGPFEYDPAHNPLGTIRGTRYFQEHADRFVGSGSDAETRAIMAQIDQEEADRRTLDAAGGAGLALQMLAGTLDPTIALPAGTAVRAARGGYSLARSAASVGLAAAGQVAAQESVLQATQQTRTAGETALNIGSATLLSALLGAGAARLLTTAERRALTAALDADRAAMDRHAGNVRPLNPEPPAAADGTVSEPSGLAASVGAAAADTRRLEPVSSGIDKVPGLRTLSEKASPMQRLFGSESVAARRVAADLAETPLLMRENLEFIPTTAGPALDRKVLLHITQTRIAVGDEIDRLFAELRFGEEVAAPRLRAWFQDMTGRGEGRPTMAQFKAMVTDALRNGDQHEIPQVAQAAQLVRRRVFDPWKERAIAAGLLPEDVSPRTADSYVQRVYNKEAIAANRPAFVDRVTEWLSGDQTTKAAAKERLTFFNAQLRSWEDQIKKLDARFGRAEEKAKGLEARASERGREMASAEQRARTLADRANQIIADIEDLRDTAETVRGIAKLYPESNAALARSQALLDSRLVSAQAEAARAAEIVRIAATTDERSAALRGRSDGVAKEVVDLQEVVDLTEELVSKNPNLAKPLRQAEKALARRIVRAKVEEARARDAASIAERTAGRAETLEERSARIAEEAKEISEAHDQMAAALARYPSLAPVVERAEQLLESRIQAGRVQTARTAEAQLGLTRNRRRINVIEDMLAKTEDRKALIDDYVGAAEKVRDEVRAKIEAEIAAWEGKSVGEAKSALRAREKYAAQRAPDKTDRLISADDAIDRAVKRIIESDRDLPVAELRSRADEITDRILGSIDGRLPYDIGQGGPVVGPAAGGEPPRGPLAAREFAIPDAMIAEFLENDIEHIVNTHLRTMVPDVMLTERFGDTAMTEAFRKINDEYAALATAAKSEKQRVALEMERQGVIRDIAAIRDRVRGTYGFSSSAPTRNAARVAAAAKNYNVLTSMGVAAVSSLPDMAGPVFRHGMTAAFGDAWAPFVRFVTRSSDAWQEGARQYRAMGIATEMVLASRVHALNDIMDSYRPQSRVERALQWGADKFQFVNLLAPWTDWAKTNAALVSGSEILRAADAVARGTASKKMVRTLAENGIDAPMAERIATAFRTGGEVRDGVHLPNTADWTDTAARRAFEGAVSRETDIAVITPGQEKPLWMSDPVFSVFGQFKSFMASATERILIANLQRRDAQVMQGLVFSLGLGMLSYKLNALTGGSPTSDKPQDWIKEAISRSGLLGWFEEGNALASKATRGGLDVYRLIGAEKPLTRYASRSALDQVLGPTAGKLSSILKVSSAAAVPSEWSESDTKALRRLIAGQNVFYVRLMFDEVEAGANNAFGIEMKPKK